ncbi:MAG TPA: ABC transporter substrate-binding protein [Firmicutes bacterium]|nr:ABC transporter substrate-binding protein [Bacillota bacterium]
MTGRRLASMVLALLLVASLGLGCSKPASKPPAEPTVAVYANSSEVMVFWDPSDSFSNEIIAMNTMYETLLRYDSINDKFIPVLATDYSRSADGLEWTFHIRKGVKFHTGNTMDAHAVKYSIERTMQRGKGASFIWDAVKEIDTPDDYTVVFKLKYAAPMDIVVSSGYAAFIFDPQAVKEHGEDWFAAGHEAGTGPYMLESYDKATDLVLTKFPDYWKGWEGKHFDKVVFRQVTEPTTRRQMIEAGDADYANQLPLDQIAELKNNPKVKVVVTPSFQNLLGMLNTEKKPLDNPDVRRALSYAVPYQDIISAVMFGYATQGRGPVPKGLWGHSEEVPQYTYDLEKAKSLLEKAGYGKGGLKLLLTYTSGDEQERRVAELMKASLAKLGIDLEIRVMNWEQQWDLAKNPDPQKRQDILLFYWWPDYADPYSFLTNLFHSEKEIVFNLCYYKNPAYDKLIEEGHQISGVDRNQAIAKYVEAQKLLVDDAAALFLYDQQYVRVIASSLQGFADNPAYPHVVWWYDCYRE